jgi:hypothetical protein
MLRFRATKTAGEGVILPLLKCLVGGLRHFNRLRNGGPPGPVLKNGKKGLVQVSAEYVVAPGKPMRLSEDREQWRGQAGPP